MKTKTTVLLRAGVLFALLLVLIWIWPAIVLTSWSFSSERPRQLQSVGRMKAAMVAVVNYYLEIEIGLPFELVSATQDAGVTTPMTDGWGRPLRYWTTATNGFEIVSLGRDGVPGGSGLDADMRISVLIEGQGVRLSSIEGPDELARQFREWLPAR